MPKIIMVRGGQGSECRGKSYQPSTQSRQNRVSRKSGKQAGNNINLAKGNGSRVTDRSEFGGWEVPGLICVQQIDALNDAEET